MTSYTTTPWKISTYDRKRKTAIDIQLILHDIADTKQGQQCHYTRHVNCTAVTHLYKKNIANHLILYAITLISF